MSLLITSKSLFRQTEVPVIGTRFANRPLMQSEPHRHEFFEIVFVESGSLTNELRTGIQNIDANHVLLIGPYVRHLLRPQFGDQHLQAHVCSFLPKAIDSSIKSLDDIRGSQSPYLHYIEPFIPLAKDQTSARIIKLTSRKGKTFSRIMEEITKLSEDDLSSNICKRRIKFLELLMFLSNSNSDSSGYSKTTNEEKGISTTNHNKGMRRAIKYLHDNLSETIRLKQMASLSGLSENKFSIQFKQFTGFTFKTYLNQLRLDQACSLLSNSSDSITDICYKVGFNDYSHFSRDFKKQTGLSPRDYRNNESLRRLDAFSAVG